MNPLSLSLSLSLEKGVKVQPKDGTTCSFGQMNIPHTPNKFNALQFHIHTYSEHEIVGKGQNGFFPAELHVVHQEETEESYAVFGTMIDVGEEDHKVFEYFLQGWEYAAQQVEEECPESSRRMLEEVDEDGAASSTFKPVQKLVQCPAIGESPTMSLNSTYVVTNPPVFPTYPAGPNVYTLPTKTDFGVYTYKGGLTTPACTEIVNWNLLDEAMTISMSQMLRLQSLILCYVQQTKDDDGNVVSCNHATVADENGSTSRPPQPLNGRRIIHRCRDGPEDPDLIDVGVQPDFKGETVFAPSDIELEPDNTSTHKCQQALYEDCSEDKRFNPTISPNLKANAPSWHSAEGYWVGTVKAYDAQGNPLKEVFTSKMFRDTLPYPRDQYQLFVNRTIKETRYYEQTYSVFKPASAEFCSLPVPGGSSNVRGWGTCGETGYARASSKYAVASFEKDGSAEFLTSEGNTGGKIQPVGDKTFYKVLREDNVQIVETSTFSSGDTSQISGSGQSFIYADVPPYSENPLSMSYTFVIEQVDEETFKRSLTNAYLDNNIIAENKIKTIESGHCIEPNPNPTEICPDEAFFAMFDPVFAESPYVQEPRVKIGFIILFVAIGVTGLFLVAYLLHKKRVAQQEEAFKDLIAQRLGGNIEFKGDRDALTPEALEAEFKRVDKDGNGSLDKVEMRLFIGDKLSTRDFNAMFIAMDVDGNGTIEFAEFCAFLTRIGIWEAKK